MLIKLVSPITSGRKCKVLKTKTFSLSMLSFWVFHLSSCSLLLRPHFLNFFRDLKVSFVTATIFMLPEEIPVLELPHSINSSNTFVHFSCVTANRHTALQRIAPFSHSTINRHLFAHSTTSHRVPS